jgi:phosphoribosylformylglycinamidine synthase
VLSRIAELIPGTDHWPLFVDNESEQFEARVSMVQIRDTNTRHPSIFLHGMSGSSLPIAVSHGEGRAAFKHPSDLQAYERGADDSDQIRRQLWQSHDEISC